MLSTVIKSAVHLPTFGAAQPAMNRGTPSQGQCQQATCLEVEIVIDIYEHTTQFEGRNPMSSRAAARCRLLDEEHHQKFFQASQLKQMNQVNIQQPCFIATYGNHDQVMPHATKDSTLQHGSHIRVYLCAVNGSSLGWDASIKPLGEGDGVQ